MSSQYNGNGISIINSIPGPVSILSSTNANPIVITTSTVHGLMTGDTVSINDHQTNYSANGDWVVSVLTTTTFSIDHAGVGVGGATGTVQTLQPGPTFAIPSDGDNEDVASVNVSIETLGDRTAWAAIGLGAYRLVSVTSYVGDDATYTAWASVSPGSTGTDTVLSGTPLPFLVQKVRPFDLVEVQLDATVNHNDTTGVDLSLYYNCTAPGASAGSFSKLTGSSRRMFVPAASSSQTLPISLRGVVSGSTITVPGALGISPYGSIQNSGKTIRLIGDYYFTAKLWRRTAKPQ